MIGDLTVLGHRIGLRRAATVTLTLVVTGLGVAAPAQARAVTPKPGYYLGYSGAYTLAFRVSAHGATVTGLTTDFQANGGSGCMPAPEVLNVRFGSMKISAGAFHGSAHPSSATPTTDAIRGSFASATRVTGRISSSYTITSLPPCHGTEPFVAQYVGPTAAATVSTLTVTGNGHKATFADVSAQFGNLVEPTDTPKLGAAGEAFITYSARRLSAAQSAALKGPITSAVLHLVVAGSPFVNATYRFTGATDKGISSFTPGVFQITLDYTDVRKGS